MKHVAIATLILAPALFGQSLVPSFVDNGPIRAGSTVKVAITAAGVSAASLAGWQATIRSTTGGAWTVVAGPSSTAAAKSLSCADNAAGYKCLDVGINQNTLADGVVAIYSLTIPTSATPGQATITLPAAELLGATLAGTPVALASVPLPFTLASQISPCDFNADGTTDILDVQLMIPQVLGLAACSNDLDSDGKCSVVDVVRLITAANGGACRVGQ